MRKTLALLACTTTLFMASTALAAAPTALRDSPTAYGGVVTLGDLFDGAQGPSAKVVVGRSLPGSQAVLDSGQVQMAAHAAGLDWDNAQGLRRVIVTMAPGEAPDRAEGGRARRSHARAAQVLVYTRNMNAGEIVGASDLEWSDEAVAGFDAPRDPDTVIGKAARGPLRAGGAVALHELVSPKVVRRGDMISVDFASDGVSLSLEARAMNDAAPGEPVEAMNVASKKIIDAVASRPGHAAVGPEAEALRANPTLIAAAR